MATNARAPKNTTTQRTRLLRALRYRGLFSRVGRKLNVTRQHVGMVARGLRISSRVEAALRAEIERIEKEAA